MRKIKLLAGAIAIAVAAIFWVVQSQNRVRLQEANDSSQRQLEQIRELEAETLRLSNLVTQVEASSKENLNELLKLRGEVGALRKQTNELQQLRERNQSLQEALKAARMPEHSSTGNVVATNALAPLAVYPRDQWAFAGFATPEAAFQSLNWALSNGDLSLVMTNMTPDMLKDFGQIFENRTFNDVALDMKDRINKNKEVRILTRELVSDSEVILQIVGTDEGMFTPDKVDFQKVNGQWKLAPTP